ncbi:TniQ family protein [Psychrobacillus sp. FJAT-51614]|uniref:TniQ family protein n=1 Tax=Psychrobacillus mangrovi TaxID=3117745 RepID=A0ABU8F8T8_9BACI
MRPLLNRLPIMETETLSSYLFRIYKKNYHDNPYGITDQPITKHELNANQIKEESCLELSILTGKEFLFQHSYLTLNVSKDKENVFFLKTRTKCCPICLDEQIHQSFTWGINLMNVCTKHQVFLLNECTSCKKIITINSIFKNECSGCDQILSEMVTESVTDHYILKSQKELAELLLGNKGRYLGLFEIEDLLIVLSAFAQLFHGFHSFTQKNAALYKIEYTNKIPIKEKGLVNLLADLYWMFQDFDNRFHVVLQSIYQPNLNRSNRRRKQNFESMIASSESMDFIFQAYQNFRLENYIRFMNVPKNITSFDKQASEYIDKNYLTKEQIKEKFPIVDSELDYLLKTSFFTECCLTNGRATYYLKDKTEKSLLAFLEVKRDRVTGLEAANLLGIHVRSVVELIKSEVLSYSPYMENDKSISKKQMQRLLDSLKPQKIKAAEDKITLARCFEKYSKSGISLSHIISFIKNNGLQAYTQKDPYKLSDLLFEPLDLAKIITEERIRLKGYNLSQVAHELGCNERIVLKYVKAGLLGDPVVEKLNNKAFAYRFDKECIELFKMTFCSIKQIKHEYKVSETLVRNAIYRGAIKNHLDGICRKTLISKWEFEKFRSKKKTSKTLNF